MPWISTVRGDDERPRFRVSVPAVCPDDAPALQVAAALPVDALRAVQHHQAHGHGHGVAAHADGPEVTGAEECGRLPRGGWSCQPKACDREREGCPMELLWNLWKQQP